VLEAEATVVESSTFIEAAVVVSLLPIATSSLSVDIEDETDVEDDIDDGVVTDENVVLLELSVEFQSSSSLSIVHVVESLKELLVVAESLKLALVMVVVESVPSSVSDLENSVVVFSDVDDDRGVGDNEVVVSSSCTSVEEVKFLVLVSYTAVSFSEEL
jgi:hypothetical protein